MLARKFRLPIQEFKRKTSRAAVSPHLLLKFIANNLNYNRFGIIITAKVEAKSNRRHFLKRRLIENLDTWPNFNQDFLIIALPKIKEMKILDLRAETRLLLNAFKKNYG